MSRNFLCTRCSGAEIRAVKKVGHDQKLCGIYSCSDREDMTLRWAGRVARTEARNVCRISVGISVVRRTVPWNYEEER
jgi:hypothetical protein